jgi:hypothetical protein
MSNDNSSVMMMSVVAVNDTEHFNDRGVTNDPVRGTGSFA